MLQSIKASSRDGFGKVNSATGGCAELHIKITMQATSVQTVMVALTPISLR